MKKEIILYIHGSSGQILDEQKGNSCKLVSSGGSKIFERGVQVQADYGNSTDSFIMAGEFVYAEVEKLVPFCAKCGKFSEFRTIETSFAGFSGAIRKAFV